MPLVGRTKNTFIILALCTAITAISMTSHAQLTNTPEDSDPYPQTCIPQDRYPEDQVQICLDCSGRLYVSGIRVSIPDLDLVLTKLETLPRPLTYKVKANTGADMTTYLKVRGLLDAHNISSEYKITFANRRSLCR